MKNYILVAFVLCTQSILFTSCQMGPGKVKQMEIDCTQIKSMLHDIYLEDQAIREDGVITTEDEAIDFGHLEVVVNILEKCGMPSIANVDTIGMEAIFFTLQHATFNDYPQKYLEEMRKAAQKGDLKSSLLALFEDRINMREHKPQIYGTQVMDNKLYDLADPEYVNQRRESVGLGPIEEYLKNWNIEFKVPQKEK